MLDRSPCEIKFVQKSSPIKGDDFLYALIFKFFTTKKLKYIIRAEYFKNEVYAIKYYVARDRRRDDKFYRLTNEFNAAEVFVTCASILPVILKCNPAASFCFNATRSREDKKDRIESMYRNQRFRLYMEVILRFIGVETFDHYSFEEVSSYLLINKLACSDTEGRKDKIREMFLDIFDFHESI
ncbi:MAG: hypothetical protein LBV32_08130 [Tannerellaceae bacterium]|jgi:hypothetical protein|nr:hypothetical protein [Tannerellaceae bacterium]